MEEGTWFFANGLYSIVTTRVNSANVDAQNRAFRDVYRIIELTGEKLTYADLGTGAEFSMRRVPDSFRLEENCPLTN